jgi:hypothetical protein
MDFAAPDIAIAWAQATPTHATEVPLGLTASALVGRWRLRLLDVEVVFELTSEGRVRTAEGAAHGVWTSRGPRVWIVGLASAPIIVASQFVQTAGEWRMTGWCSRSLGDVTSFSLEPVMTQRHDVHEHGA